MPPNTSDVNPAIYIETPNTLGEYPASLPDDHKSKVLSLDTGKPEFLEAEEEKKCNLVAFFLFGLLNNFSYVVMIAGAKEISNGGVGLSYIFGMFPTLLVQFIGPYVMDLMSYQHRVWICAMLMAASFITVGIGNLIHSVEWQLVGVALCGFQSGIGEAAFLALASMYNSRSCLTAWSSGTGIAGVAGYGWIYFMSRVVNLPFSSSLFIANGVVFLWIIIYYCILDREPIQKKYFKVEEPLGPLISLERQPTSSVIMKEVIDVSPYASPTSKSHPLISSTKARFQYIVNHLLFPYMCPLLVVYFSKYVMQSGTWAAIGFPMEVQSARDAFYFYANFSYQLGVFFARSSGTLVQANRLGLWTMSLASAGLLLLFSAIALYQFWYSYGPLIPLAFLVGLLAGGVYINAFTLMTREIPPIYLEFALGTVVVANSLGAMLGNGAGLYLQCAIYKYHDVAGAVVQC